MAALYAKSLSVDKMRPKLKYFCDTFRWGPMLMHFTLPVLSYFNGRRFTKRVATQSPYTL